MSLRWAVISCSRNVFISMFRDEASIVKSEDGRAGCALEISNEPTIMTKTKIRRDILFKQSAIWSAPAKRSGYRALDLDFAIAAEIQSGVSRCIGIAAALQIIFPSNRHQPPTRGHSHNRSPRNRETLP